MAPAPVGLSCFFDIGKRAARRADRSPYVAHSVVEGSHGEAPLASHEMLV